MPVERANGSVLFIAVGEDALWSSERVSWRAFDRLQRHDRPFDDDCWSTRGAGT
ncbi:MAG: hypothetical protein CYG60_23440 [Actinobacteria bacterium]|nr:MAG: hypothetical protein CYG60_23440 [Actinomycetota bacterium]